MSPKLFDTFRKKPLDPSRHEVVFTSYDEERGYQAYHKYCQKLLKRTVENSANNTLAQYGIEHISVLDQIEALDTLTTIIQKYSTSVKKEHIDYSEMLTISDRQFVESLFEKIFTPTLDQKLVEYFKSEYFIYWYTVLRATPSPQARRSFLWHCDKGPSSHIKLLLYLNGTEEHGGNTKFLDRQTTAKFIKTGYIFGPVDARQSDLSTLAKSANINYSPKKWDMKPGDGILFEPSQILHCGVLPTNGPRYVIAFCLLPSPIPRQEAFKRTKEKGLSEDYAWHQDAEEIRQALLQTS